VLTSARAELITNAGGFLKNVRWGAAETCRVCAGIPNPGYATCYHCEGWSQRDDLSDRLGFTTYAIDGTQSAWVMYGYKDQLPSDANARVVRLLHHYAVSGHWECINSSPLGPVTHWTTVPSLRGRTGPHRLRTVAAELLTGRLPVVDMRAGDDVQSTRDLRPENFAVEYVPTGAHVLLIEDTWVGGGRTQSAAAALKRAGARAVTSMVLARWLTPGRGATTTFVATLGSDFEPDLCPFTGTACGAPQRDVALRLMS
jgi:hypothetical protein